MQRNAWKKLVCAAFLFLLACTLCGCSSQRDIQEIKQNMILDEDISMRICWPETSYFGMQLRRIVNNYNLSASVRVQLQFCDRETAYFEELRRQTATATLADVFITVEHPGEPFWRGNDKMLDLAPVHQALALTDAAGLDTLQSGDKVDGIFLAEAMEGLALYNAFLPQAKWTDLTEGLLDTFEACQASGEMLNAELDVDEFAALGKAADYLAMLVQSRQHFSYDEDMPQLLSAWKKTLPLFGGIQEGFGDEGRNMSILTFYHSGLETDESHIPLTGQYVSGGIFSGYRYYVSAAAQSVSERKENVFRFLTYLLEETSRLWGSGSALPSQKLWTRELPVAQREWLNEQLRLYAKDMIDAGTCFQLLREWVSEAGG